MIDSLIIFIYIFIFPGFLFLIAYALILEFLDRRITARMQHRVGPPFYQPLADFIKMLGKEVIDPDGADLPIFDKGPLVALAAVMTAFLYIPVVGISPLAFQGDLVLVLYLFTLPTIALFLLGWLSRNIFSAMGGIRAVTQMFIYEVPFFLALLTPGTNGWNVVSFRDYDLATKKYVVCLPSADWFCNCLDRTSGKTGKAPVRYSGSRD